MTHGRRHRLLGSLALAGSVFAATAAQAQTREAPQSQARTAAEAQTPVPTSAAEVVVTAEKRTQRLVKVPASVTAVPGARLEQIQATDMSDWAGFVPGVNVDSVGAPGETFLSIDGVAPIAAASEVGIYVGDVPVGSSSSFQGGNGFSMDLLPYDLDRIEVLRGPQGTLYGASTMGGLIKYVLDAPNLEQFSGRVGGDLFAVNHAVGAGGGVRGEINAPIVQDKLGLRLSAYDENTPGYIGDPILGVKGDNPLAQYGGRATLLWRPTTDVSVQLEAIYQHSHADNQAVAALDTTTAQPIYGALDNINARNEPYTQALQLYDGEIDWDLHFATLTSVTSYQQFDNHTVEDLTRYIGVYLGYFGAPGPGQAQFNEDYQLKKVTEEVRLASPTNSRFEWLVGGYYTHETGSNVEVFVPYDATGAALPALTPLEFATLPSTYEEYAFFGNGTYHFNRWLDLSAGVRYAHNDQTFTESEGGFLLDPASPTTPVLVVPGKSNESVPTWSVSPAFHLNPDTMLYARIATGYQPGGPNVVLPGVSGVPGQFNSSRLIDYQVGLKSTLLDGHASLDLSAFYIDWTKIQVSVLIGNQSAVENAGAARSEGFDFNGTWSPIRGLEFGGTLAYADAVLTTPVPSIGAVAGARLPYVPMWSGSFTAEYSAPLNGDWRGFVGGGYRYIGSRYSAVQSSIANGELQGLEAPPYDVLDLHAGARAGNGLVLEVFAKNVLDRRAFLAPSSYFYDAIGFPIAIKAPVLQPATVGVSVEKSF